MFTLKEKILMFLGIILLMTFVSIGYWLSCVMEAETYTRLTGKQVTWIDAMWLDLRIQEQIK